MIKMNKTEFKLKNYTTTISVTKTVMQIEELLAKFGASHIMKEFLEDGTITSLMFKVNENSYNLPINSEGVYILLFKDKRGNMQQHKEQSERIAWRVLKDWLHAQLSLIASGQAEPEQVLLPYMTDGNCTMYDRYKKGLLLLK